MGANDKIEIEIEDEIRRARGARDRDPPIRAHERNDERADLRRHVVHLGETRARGPHLLLFGEATPADLIPATRGTYDGPLVVGEDLMQFEIGDEVRVNRSA